MKMPIVTMSMPQALRGECRIDGQVVYLSPQLADLLAALLVAGPRGLTWPEMVEAVWPDPDEQALDAEGVITVRVLQLRRLGVPIENHPVHGTGYLIPAEGRDPAARMVHGCRWPDACRWRPQEDRTKQKRHGICRRCSDENREERRWRLTVSANEAHVWRFTERNPGATNVQIGKALGIPPKTVEQVRKRLLAKGLLEKVVKPGGKNGRYFARMGHNRFKAQLREHIPTLKNDDTPKVVRLDPRSVDLMTAIAEDPGATADELALKLGVTNSNVWTRSNRLIERGAVEKVETRLTGRPGAQQLMRYLPTEGGMRSLNAARQEAGLRLLANVTRGRTSRQHEEIIARARAGIDRRASGYDADVGPDHHHRADHQGSARQGAAGGERDAKRDRSRPHSAELRQHG